MISVNDTDVEKHGIKLNVLNENQCRKIIQAAFRVLERTGCEIHHEAARKTLKTAGCKVDGNTVKIPPSLIETAMKSVPKQVSIFDRMGKETIKLGKGNNKSYFVAGLENEYLIDSYTGEKRATTKKDVANVGMVIDALPNIDVACGLACISDCTPQLADVYETRILLEHTAKPLLLWNFNKFSFQTQVEMCAAVSGGLDSFLKKPFVIAGAAATTPLAHAEDTIDKLLPMFELGLPTPYIAATMLGATAPVTLAGSFVVGLADTLIGLLLSQLTNPGCPFIATTFTDVMDMKTMAFALGNPETILGQAAVVDIFRYLNLPHAVHLGCTDSPVFDQQAAYEIGLQIYTGMLSRADLNFFIGYLETAMSSSLECLVYGDEIIDHIKHIISGIEVSVETLAEETIDNVGPGKNFLAEEHTLRHFRENWEPHNFIRTSYDKWSAAGRKDYKERANEKVKKILGNGPQKLLEPSVLKDLDRIVQKAEEKYLNR